MNRTYYGYKNYSLSPRTVLNKRIKKSESETYFPRRNEANYPKRNLNESSNSRKADNERTRIKNNSIIKSNNIICPICGENALIKIKDYKITLYDCKYGHVKKTYY